MAASPRPKRATVLPACMKSCRKMASHVCKFMQPTASTAKPATSKTPPPTSLGPAPKAAVGRTTAKCSGGKFQVARVVKRLPENIWLGRDACLLLCMKMKKRLPESVAAKISGSLYLRGFDVLLATNKLGRVTRSRKPRLPEKPYSREYGFLFCRQPC